MLEIGDEYLGARWRTASCTSGYYIINCPVLSCIGEGTSLLVYRGDEFTSTAIVFCHLTSRRASGYSLCQGNCYV